MLVTRPAAARLRPRPRRRGAPDSTPRTRRRAGARRSTAQTRTLDSEMVVIERRRRARPRSPVSWAARARRWRPRHDAGAARGRHLERAEHPPQLPGCSGSVARLPAASRRASSPSSACTRRPLATRLMIELCAATRCCRAPSTSARRLPAAPGDPVARGSAWRAILGVPVARERQAADPAGARFPDTVAAEDGLDVAVPALQTRGRDARGRPDRGGRAHRRPRAASRDASRQAARSRWRAHARASACRRRGRGRARRAGACTRSVGWTLRLRRPCSSGCA